ncbi:MAG: hypothetical protein ACTS41_01785 [Candidatus Hodgkinia cicadicola]
MSVYRQSSVATVQRRPPIGFTNAELAFINFIMHVPSLHCHHVNQSTSNNFRSVWLSLQAKFEVLSSI